MRKLMMIAALAALALGVGGCATGGGAAVETVSAAREPAAVATERACSVRVVLVERRIDRGTIAGADAARRAYNDLSREMTVLVTARQAYDIAAMFFPLEPEERASVDRQRAVCDGDYDRVQRRLSGIFGGGGLVPVSLAERRSNADVRFPERWNDPEN